MKRTKRTIVAVILYIVIFAMAVVCVGYFIEQLSNNGWKMELSVMIKFVMAIAGVVLTFLKVKDKIGDSRYMKMYESLYAKNIGSAFSTADSKKEKRRLLQAIEYYHNDNCDKAIKQLKSLVNDCHTHHDYNAVLLFLALSYTDLGSISEAVATYEELVKYSPSNSTAWSNLGIIYSQQGYYAKAVKAIKTAINCDANDAYEWYNLAQAHFSAYNWEMVISPALRSLELNPKLYESEKLLAVAYFATGDTENSKKYFDRAVLHGADEDKLTYMLHYLEQLEDVDIDEDDEEE